MILHMSSISDAYRYAQTQSEILTFSEFNQLVQKCFDLAKLQVPSFSVIKDLFDLIDVRRDGNLDFTEWQ